MAVHINIIFGSLVCISEYVDVIFTLVEKIGQKRNMRSTDRSRIFLFLFFVSQQYEEKLVEGENFGYDKELEGILNNHIQDVVSLTRFFLCFF